MAGFYSKGLETGLRAVTGVAAAPTGTLKLAFMATTYTQDPEADQFWADISADLASGTTVQTLASSAVAVDTVNNRVEFDTADITLSTVTTSTDKYVIFMDTGTPATSPLIACVDIAEGTLAPFSGDLSITVNSEGHFAINY